MSHANPVRYYPQGNKRFQQLSFERSVGNQTQMFYRNSNDQPNFRHGRSYNRNNHGTNNTLGGYNGKQYNCHYHNTKPSKQLFNYRREHQESLDGKLFRAIKEYANNLYSLFLMEMDVKLSVNSPKRGREYYRIWNSLSNTQVVIRNYEEVKIQKRKL
jgi:hypothetical protein